MISLSASVELWVSVKGKNAMSPFLGQNIKKWEQGSICRIVLNYG